MGFLRIPVSTTVKSLGARVRQTGAKVGSLPGLP